MMRRGPGLVGAAARTAVVVGTANRVSRRQQQKFASQDAAAQQQAAAQQPAMEQQAAPMAPDYTAELEQLAQLKAQGILTEEEFEAKKKQVLGI